MSPHHRFAARSFSRGIAGLLAGLLPVLLGVSLAADQAAYATRIAPLIDPAKLKALGKRQANPRVQRAVYWLAMARTDGHSPSSVAGRAVLVAGYKRGAAKLTKAALLRNLDIAGKLGCLDGEGLAEMRRGRAATVAKGPYKGDLLSADHLILHQPTLIPIAG